MSVARLPAPQVCFLILLWVGVGMLLGFAAQAAVSPFAFGVAAAVALAGAGWILTLYYTSRRGAETVMFMYLLDSSYCLPMMLAVA